MKNENNKDLKEWKPTEKDVNFTSGFIVACFLSTYILQLLVELSEGYGKLSVFSFIPILPFFFTLFNSLFAVHSARLGVPEMKIFDRFGTRGAFAVGFVCWFVFVALWAVIFWIWFG